MKNDNVKVGITAHLELKNEQHQNLEEMINLYFLDNEEYKLDVIGSYRSINNDVELYLVMNTIGSYEDNLGRLEQLHFKLERLLKCNGIKYNGMSLVPNKVEWN